MRNIILDPSEVWDYFFDNTNEIERHGAEIIAENPDFGIEIYVSVGSGEVPELSVLADDMLVNVEYAYTRSDCEHTVQEIYSTYLDDDFVNNILSDGSERETIFDKSEENNIRRREEEIDLAVYDFVATVLGDEFDKTENITGICDDLKEHFLKYMYEKHNLNIYRPMFLVDENDEEFYEEYPYEVMIDE